jgi:hypothetical protein
LISWLDPERAKIIPKLVLFFQKIMHLQQQCRNHLSCPKSNTSIVKYSLVIGMTFLFVEISFAKFSNLEENKKCVAELMMFFHSNLRCEQSFTKLEGR